MKEKLICLVILVSLIFVPLGIVSASDNVVALKTEGILSEIPRKVDVTIEARDENGKLLPSEFTHISAFSMDWGVVHSEMGPSSLGNPITMDLPTGNDWVFIASFMGENMGYFLEKHGEITDSQAVVLKPDAEIKINVQFNKNNATTPMGFMASMFAEDIVPLGTFESVGVIYKDTGSIVVHTNKNLEYGLNLGSLYKLADEEMHRYVFIKRNINANTVINAQISDSDLAHINFNAVGPNSEPLPINLFLQAPDIQVFREAAGLRANGKTDVYVSPGKWIISNISVKEGKWSYWFAPIDLNLKKGDNINLSFGKEFTPKFKVLQSPHPLCLRLKNKPQIWIETKDYFGNLLERVNYDGQGTSIPIKISENGKIIYQDDLGDINDPYNIALHGCIIDKTFDLNNPPDYEVKLNLGPFGDFDLKGKLFSNNAKIKYKTLTTDNFILHYPEGYDREFSQEADLLEKAHSALTKATGINLQEKTEVFFYFGNLSGIARHGRFDAGAAEVLYYSHTIAGGETLIALHEHSHSFQFEEPENYFITTAFGETIVDMMASQAYETLWGYPARRYKLSALANYNSVFDYIEDPSTYEVTLPDPNAPDATTSVTAYLNMRFILRFLELKFGDDIHKKFIAAWSKEESSMYISKNYFKSASLSDMEQIVTVYSLLTEQNLSGLFTYMGFPVNKNKVETAISEIQKTQGDKFPPYLLLNQESNMFTNEETITITGQTEPNSVVKVGENTAQADEKGDFSIDAALQSGINELLIISEDEAGNKEKQAFHVYYDGEPPQINITYPLNNATLNEKTVVIKGTVVDKESGVSEVRIEGENILLNGEIRAFSKEISLNEGDNKITIVAEDKTGNKTTKTITITYEKPVQTITIILQPDNPYMTVSGVQQEIDLGRGTKPLIMPKWSRTVVPIRAIVEALGGTIGWDGVARKVTINFNGTTIYLWIDKPQAEVNEEMKWIDPNNHDVKPIIINSRTMLPLRFVAESLGCTVDWDPTTRTITITYEG